MSLGLPVVSTDVGSVRTAVLDGETGFVVPPRDPEAITNATRRFVEDPVLSERFGVAGRKRAVENFSVELCADVHVEALNAAMRHAADRTGGS